MGERDPEGGGKLGFLDSLGRLFRGKQEAHAPAPQAPSRFAKLEADFEVAIRGLDERVEAQRHSAKSTTTTSGAAPTGMSAAERTAQRLQRRDAAHQAICDDIEKMHARLGTGLSRADLDAIAAFLVDLDVVSTEGRDSHVLLPRARYAIAERLRAEAGELAVARLVALLEREKLSWPDPMKYRPTATPEEIEGSRRRRLAEVREAFLTHGLGLTAERLQGIVRSWGGDYPDRGSPLWEESVLQGVAAGIRGRLLQDFVELLRRDRELLLSRTEETVGKELAALHAVLESGVHSIEQANQVVASSLRVIDVVVPEIAWEAVRAQLPEARGEFSPRATES